MIHDQNRLLNVVCRKVIRALGPSTLASLGGRKINVTPHFRTFLLCFLLPVAASASTSVYTERPDDPRAIALDRSLGDGTKDCTAALQETIDKLQRTWHHGIVLIPEGRYRLTGTIYVWSGIRLLGYGTHRPTFLLLAGTPGFGNEEGVPLKPFKSHYMFYFASEKPLNGAISDGNSDTFYSGMSNINFEIGANNPSAVAIRFHVAQHGILSHLDMKMGSAHAALEDVGNQASDLYIDGGDYGIVTGKTAPGWQFLLMDSVLEHQRKAAIRSQEAGMTLIRVHFRNTPVGVQIPEGEVEQLYIRDSSFTSISNAALQPGDDLNVRSQISAENIACKGVRRFLSASVAAPELAPQATTYVLDRLRLGLHIANDGRPKAIKLEHHEHPGAIANMTSDIPAIPPMSEWTNVRSLGALGDGIHDDTAALTLAIAAHSTLYFPAGKYRLTATLHLRPNTVLIGLHPFTTQLLLADHTPGFGGKGEMVPLIAAPEGGSNIVTGIGVSTGTVNPRAAGILWQAGPKSMIQDVKFIGGRGTLGEDGQPLHIYPEPAGATTHRSDAWSSQYPSLTIRGGGGILRAIWSASTFAQAGLVIENTRIRGRIYQLSCEHHMRLEVQIHGVSNWQILALQTEEERLEGANAVALEISASHAMEFGNLFMYRVSRSIGPAPYAAAIDAETQADFANLHTMANGRYAFDNSILDKKSGVTVRSRDFTSLSYSGGFAQPKPLPLPAVFSTEAPPRLLATGFTDITGFVPTGKTDLLFTDSSIHQILRWSTTSGLPPQALELPQALAPVVLASPGNGNTLLLDATGNVMRFDPSKVATTLLSPVPREGNSLLFPTGGHNSLHTLQGLLSASVGYLAEPGGAILPLARDTRNLLSATHFAMIHLGIPSLIASEEYARILQLTLASHGAAKVTTFAEYGGTSVVQDEAGNVYVAGDQLQVYDATGHFVGTVELPTRPTALTFTGPDHRTLLIGARSSLYSLRTKSSGRTE
jgi:hypothetical protein